MTDKDQLEEDNIQDIKVSLLKKESNISEDLQPLIAGEEKERKNAYERSTIFGKLSFWWVFPMMQKGNKEYLEQIDHDPLRKRDQSRQLFQKFSEYWEYYSEKNKGSPLALYKTLLGSQKWMVMRCFFFQFLNAGIDLIKPLIIGALISYAGKEPEDKDIGIGIAWVAVMILCTVFQNFISLHADYQFNMLGYCLNNSVTLALFEKSLKVSLQSNKEFKSGQIINIVQVDANRIYLMCNQIAMLLFLPIQLIVGLYLIFMYVGVAFLAGLGVIFIFGIANFFITKLTIKYQNRLLKNKDERMKVTNEVFGQIKFIKVNAWEEYFYDRINEKRELELKTLLTKIYVQLVSIWIFWLTSPSILNAVFGWYTLTGHDLTPGIAFPVISLFNSLSGPIQQIPQQITNMVETHLSVKRIQKYLTTEEIDIRCIEQNPNPSFDEQTAISVTNGTFSWGKSIEDIQKEEKEKKDKKKNKKKDNKENQEEERKTLESSVVSIDNKDEAAQFREKTMDSETGERELGSVINQQQPNILKDINIKIQKGKMVAFIGDVGSGKSSFLQALVGEMRYNDADNPQIKINGNLALVNQKPWIQSDTIKNNILFGKEFETKRYEDTIKYACLETDFKVLTNGEDTMIGEKGVNLSGGQKARIALARAIYSDADILLLDDILSAVDIHVGKSIVKDCLMRYKASQTRVLVTHALSYVKYMDYIYLLEGGSIAVEGNYEDIKNSDQFQKVYNQFMKEQYDKQKEEEEQQQLQQPILGAKQISKEEAETLKELEIMKLEKKKSAKLSMKKSRSDLQEEEKELEKEKDKIDDLIMEEDRNKGQIGGDAIKKFISFSGGWWFLLVVILASTVSAGSRVLQSLWIVEWTEHAEDEDNRNNFYLGIFSLFTIGISVAAAIRASIVFLCMYRTGRKIHRGMISNLLYAPLNEFFDRVPLGRIINRLSKDMNILDSMISFALASLMASVFFCLGTVFLCVYSSSYWVILPIIFYIIVCFKIYSYYITANREIVRLEAITKSPVVSYFGESLNGLHSIRTFKRQSEFINKQCYLIDENKKNQIMTIATGMWFRMILTLLSVIINLPAISFAVFYNSDNPDNQSMVGLLLTYSLSLDLIIRWMIMMLGFFEQRLVSFERCEGFLHLENEPGYTNYIKQLKEFKQQGLPMPQNLELTDWPQEGVIEFKDTWVKYRKTLDPVLKGLSINVKKEEKVGIVGRTGAGKSTITLCLLRVLELMKGQIIIDGQDISELSLEELRKKITIILQDPHLFEGTLRENIDPLKEKNDYEILETLEQCNLKQFMNERSQGLQSKLDIQISEGGGNLSVGEKQLICIARALLKKSKLVLIDEATANIDIQTEHMVQETIKTVFKDCTVLTIAHRINTILESDRILVLNNGQVEEFDSPQVLLQNPASLFYKLHEEALKENKI